MFRGFKRFLGSAFSLLGVSLTWFLLISGLLSLFMAADKGCSVWCCQFDDQAPWLVWPFAIVGFVFSRIFIKKPIRKWVSRAFVLLVALWVFVFIYLGPVEFRFRLPLPFFSCKPEKFLEAEGGRRRLGIYLKQSPLPMIREGILVRDERKVFPLVWSVRILFWGIADDVEIEKKEGFRYLVKVFDYHKSPAKVVGKIFWP